MESARKDGEVPIKRTNTDVSAMRSENSSLKYFGSDAGKSKSYFGPPASQPSPAAEKPSSWTPGKKDQNQTSNTPRNTPKQELKSEVGESRLSSSFESRYSVSRTNEEKNIVEPIIRTVSHFWI
jgi:hypothetical protein